PYRFIATLFWYLVTFAYAFEKLLGWYFNVYIVTTDRVVDIDFNNLLDKKFSEADLAVIQDVSSHVAGVSQTVFNYGTILIQTAAEIPEISFEKVPNPEKIVKVLQELRQEKINGGHHA
ncbi:MAG TPA: PH domain-containing protein, partial [Patescibacteria group bacterium]